MYSNVGGCKADSLSNLERHFVFPDGRVDRISNITGRSNTVYHDRLFKINNSTTYTWGYVSDYGPAN